jgi:hypothetical protein
VEIHPAAGTLFEQPAGYDIDVRLDIVANHDAWLNLATRLDLAVNGQPVASRLVAETPLLFMPCGVGLGDKCAYDKVGGVRGVCEPIGPMLESRCAVWALATARFGNVALEPGDAVEVRMESALGALPELARMTDRGHLGRRPGRRGGSDGDHRRLGPLPVGGQAVPV